MKVDLDQIGADLTLRRLRTLVAIADAKTFTAAADAVHVTHAAVSQQMRSLEADLGLELFDRNTRTPELTPLAHRLVARARTLIDDYDDLIPSVLSDDGLSGTLALGVLGSTLTGLAPVALAELKKTYPGLGLRVRPGLTGALLDDILTGAMDAAVVTKAHVLPDGIRFRELAVEPLHLIASSEETEDDPRTLLTKRPFIRFNRTAVLGALIENWLVDQGIRVKETMELDGTEAITSMVHANIGVSIMPILSVPPQRSLPIKHISLGPNPPSRTLGLAHLDSPIKAKAMDALFEVFQGVISNAQRTKTS